MKSFEKLAAFVAVAEHGTFSKAAEILYCSQPALSMKIRSLEEQLNTQLFFRKGKQVILTPCGEQYLPYAKEMCRLFHHSSRMLTQQQTEEYQTVQLFVTTCLNSHIILDAQAEFKRRNPQCSLQIIFQSNDQLIKRLEEGTIGEAIVLNEGAIDDRFDKHFVYEDEFLAVVSGQHNNNQSIEMVDVADKCLLLTDCGCPLRNEIKTEFHKQNLLLRNYVEFNHIDMVKQNVLTQQGVAFLPKSIIDQELAEGNLTSIQMFKNVLKKKYYFVHRSQHKVLPMLSNFIKILA